MTAAIELETFLAHLDRPGATRFQPGPPQGPPPTGPGTGDGERPGPRIVDPDLTRWAPHATRAHLIAATTGTDDLIAGSRADVAELRAGIARLRALREVA